MPSSRTPTPSRVGPYRASLELAGGDPISFLEAFEGEARGFWGQRDRWVAWGGVLARIEVPPPDPARFDRVRDEASSLLTRFAWDPSEGEAGHPPRFFGGFSFLRRGGAGEEWSGFPSAGFILPRVVVEGREGGVRLLSAGDPARLQELSHRLTRQVARPSTGLTAPSAPTVAGLSPSDDPDLSGPGFGADPTGLEKWRQGVESVLKAIRAGRVEKAVLARILDARMVRDVDPLRALRFLWAENERAHVYLIEPKPGRSFLGAAPELLARLRGDRFEATAVAGSMPRASERGADGALARRLMASEKDREEHRLTVEDMVEVLAPHLSELEVDEAPRVLSLARIHHLETLLHGRSRPEADILSLVEVLHPTPAVCGRPRGEALELIRAAELFDRGWYSGPVGWFDAAGDGEFVPALRGALGGGRNWRLFAGAGIVAGSDADAEWDETALKFEPALRALVAGTPP